MHAQEEPHVGVMDGSYARGRERSPALVFRYRVRAQMALDAFHARAMVSPDGPKVLDLGAADALTLLEMRRLFGGRGRYTGVELSEELLGSVPDLPEDVEVVRGDVQQLPQSLEEGSYDLCTALALLEHLPDPDACVREAYRMLRPGGVCVVSCPNPVWDDVAHKLGLMKGDHHEQEMDRARLIAVVRDAGFENVEYVPFMFAPVGFLPYLRVPVDAVLSLRIDSALRRLRPIRFGYVNQAVVGTRPNV